MDQMNVGKIFICKMYVNKLTLNNMKDVYGENDIRPDVYGKNDRRQNDSLV